MSGIFARIAISGVIGLFMWFIIAPLSLNSDAVFGEKVSNVIFVLYITIAIISIIAIFVGLLGFVWTF